MIVALSLGYVSDAGHRTETVALALGIGITPSNDASIAFTGSRITAMLDNRSGAPEASS